MASWIFTEAMLAGKPIRVFNHGEMWRDFTYIDDIVDGVVAVLDKPPADGAQKHALYNIGNSQPVHLGRFIDTLESLLGVKAIRHNERLQPGEVEKTYADTSALERDFGFKPKVPVEEGLKKFVDWYRGEWRPEGKR
jgi:UDP-glucuronate 4-epimerase